MGREKIKIKDTEFTNSDLCNYISYLKDSNKDVDKDMIKDFMFRSPSFVEYKSEGDVLGVTFNKRKFNKTWFINFKDFKDFLPNSDKKYFFDLRQETIYTNSDLVQNKWFRRAIGGQWYKIKLGKDTPWIEMFAYWVKRPDWLSGHKDIIEQEMYPATKVDTKWKLFIQVIKNIYNDFVIKS